MKLNRRRGATLGLVAVAVLVIIVLGVGFFILSQILGGGREVANATDAGVLNVARRALSPTLIQVVLPTDSNNYANASDPPYNDFLGAAIDANGVANQDTANYTSNRISMLAVNRILAQAALVALNAEYLNTSSAGTHAIAVATAAKNVSRSIKTLVEGNTLDSQFTVVAQSNNTKMFQGNKVQLTGLSSAFLRTGQSTNVYVDPSLALLPEISLPPNFKNANNNALTHDGLGGQDKYMAGYTNFNITVPTGSVDIAGVPIFPKQKPHLVDTGEYSTAAAPTTDYLPPNAFRANSSTQDNNSGGFGGAVSCALVGALDQDFPVSIPRGYVRIKNGIDAATDPNTAVQNILSSPVVDAGTDVFNNELWPPNGGVDITNNGVFALKTLANNVPNPDYGAAQNYIDSWRNHNTNPGTYPTAPAYPPTVMIYKVSGTTLGYDPAPPSGALPIGDFQAIGSLQTNCDMNNYFGNGQCRSGGFGPAGPGSLAYSIMGINGALNGVNSNATDGSGFSAIEVQKHELLSHRYGTGNCSSVGAVIGSPKPYGMKVFTVGQCYNTPNYKVNFGAIGSPKKLLDQIGGNGQGACETSVITKITNRMKQVDPGITDAKVRIALDLAPLPLGKSLYLYSPGPGLVTLVADRLDTSSTDDYFDPNIVPDGTNSPTAGALETCTSTYDLQNKVVDSAKSAGCSIGDAGFHERPYMDYSGSPLNGVDKAVWTPASGWRNMLGEINFQNEATGAGTFCKPN